MIAPENRPLCRLIGENGNIFNLMAIARRTLRDNGYASEGDEMCERIMNTCDSYRMALSVIQEYVEVI